MTGSELRSALKTLGMRQLEFAGILRCRPETVSRYVKDRNPIPGSVESLVSMMLRKVADDASCWRNENG
jgi:transcriptional regulator with XRE-family HTH domain